MRVAIMQPYFVPYTGYFRLFTAADLFIIYDCVQFPRRGWVHRNHLTSIHGTQEWLSLPLAKAPREVLIKDLTFRTTAVQDMAQQLNKFPHLAEFHSMLFNFEKSPVMYLADLLQMVCQRLQLPYRVLRSSTLDIAPTLKGQNRIISICKEVGATHYINSPGGKALYDPEGFAGYNLELSFLSPYHGSMASILERLVREDAISLSHEITSQAVLEP